MKSANYTLFTFILSCFLFAPSYSSPLLSVEAQVDDGTSTFIIVEPSFQLESRIHPADLPPVDTTFMENDVDEDFEEEKQDELKIHSGIVGNNYRWITNVDFQISTDFSQAERNVIDASLGIVAGVLSNCRVIRVFPNTPSGDYVFITKAQSGCSSAVGRRGGGRQNLNLGSGCVHQDIAVHEMIHAIGFHHEQIRPDRDSLVNILWENIKAGTEHNFRLNSLYTQTYNVPYDYYSIMHYYGTAFSANGRSTIQAKQSGIIVGSRGVVTDSDRRKIRAMYNCP